jgi:hypothetical protein
LAIFANFPESFMDLKEFAETSFKESSQRNRGMPYFGDLRKKATRNFEFHRCLTPPNNFGFEGIVFEGTSFPSHFSLAARNRILVLCLPRSVSCLRLRQMEYKNSR